mmetsp:Transcript_9087/g.11243  ORF Transcript_9087/g.11243 Transcript_9087/m.11243 type:complete len:88 (-) Transcript_9087:21-284(-)
MVLYSMIAMQEPFKEIDNPFRIYEAIYKEQFPLISKEKEDSYSVGLIKLHRSCIRVKSDQRPCTSEILIVLDQLLWAIENNLPMPKG